ncbi:hypothetical protein L226DRAFT_290467 [Lentinus tigrinus ALCF2SS1-7]|uniref:uncharacterized protein n=1 Tax=Lentinus tigrinus ALCF2SS1-7 TaxID=1328758 RepID=UPI0011660E33|nr:hypothetical protein L226DRAFT_290467 [Lentinus tigrinus ALCF2SS1-7]
MHRLVRDAVTNASLQEFGPAKRIFEHQYRIYAVSLALHRTMLVFWPDCRDRRKPLARQRSETEREGTIAANSGPRTQLEDIPASQAVIQTDLRRRQLLLRRPRSRRLSLRSEAVQRDLIIRPGRVNLDLSLYTRRHVVRDEPYVASCGAHAGSSRVLRFGLVRLLDGLDASLRWCDEVIQVRQRLQLRHHTIPS